MRYLHLCYSEEDVLGYVCGLFQTEDFRNSFKERGFVYDIVHRFAQMPRIFGEMTDDTVEWAHFSAWWGVIPKRNYANPAIGDLYYLHEMTHAGRMAHIPNQSFSGFARRLFENELEASVVSEIQAYFELPGLRAKTFPHEIYADRFLRDASFGRLWRGDRDTAIAYMKEARREVYYAGAEIETDMCARWLKRFAHQNQCWAEIWARRYNEVETAMHSLQQDCLNHAAGRKEGLDRLLTWLKRDSVTPVGTDIPFPEEAHTFAAVYGLMKSNYVKDMAVLQANGAPHVLFYPSNLDDETTSHAG